MVQSKKVMVWNLRMFCHLWTHYMDFTYKPNRDLIYSQQGFMKCILVLFKSGCKNDNFFESSTKKDINFRCFVQYLSLKWRTSPPASYDWPWNDYPSFERLRNDNSWRSLLRRNTWPTNEILVWCCQNFSYNLGICS